MTFAFAKNYASLADAITAAEADQIGDDELVGVLVGKVTRGYTNKPGSSVVADGVFVVAYTGGRLIRFGSAQDILDQRYLIACKADAGADPKQYEYGSTILHTRFVDETDKYHLVTNGAHTEIDSARIQHDYMLDTSRNQMVIDLAGKLAGDKFYFPRPEAESTLGVSIAAGTGLVSIAAIRLVNAGGGFSQVQAADNLAAFIDLGLEVKYADDTALSADWPVVPAGSQFSFKPNGKVPFSAVEVELSANAPGTGNIGAQPEAIAQNSSAVNEDYRQITDVSPLADRTIKAGAKNYQVRVTNGSANFNNRTFTAADDDEMHPMPGSPTGSDKVITLSAGGAADVWEAY